VDIYSLGDVIDRGPDSKGALDICVREGVNGICGNHELWFGQVLAGGKMDEFPYSNIMGGLATLASYGLRRGDPDHVGPALRQAVPSEHREWILNLPPYRVITVGSKSYLLIHSGIPASALEGLAQTAAAKVPDETKVEVLLRLSPDAFFWTGAKPKTPGLVGAFSGFCQVFGHTPVREAMVFPHFIALDTGCGTCPPYSLSAAVILPNSTGIEILSVR